MPTPLEADDLLVYRTTVILQALADAAQQREMLTAEFQDEVTIREDVWTPKGRPSDKTPFKFQDPSYQPNPDEIEPSPEVLARWNEYLAEHPDAAAEHVPIIKTPSLGKRPRSPSPSPPPPPTPSKSAARRARKQRVKAKAAAANVTASSAAAESSAATSSAAASPFVSSAAVSPSAAAISSAAASSAAASSSAAAASSSAAATLSSAAATSSPAATANASLPLSPPTAFQKRSRGQGNREAKRRKEDAEWRAGHSNTAFDPNSLPRRLAAKHLRRVKATKAEQLEHAHLATNRSTHIGPPPISKGKVEHLQDFNWPAEDTEDLPPTVQKYLAEGFHIMKNDPTKTQVIEDANGVILALKALPPRSMLWKFIVDSVEEQLAKLDAALTDHALAKEKGTNRTDGNFKHVTVGVSMGGGQKEPKYLNIRNEWHDPVRAFIDHPDVRIYAQHMSNIFRFWFPKLFQLYEKLVTDFNDKYPDFHGAFPGFPMNGETKNTGKKTKTPEHVDFKNALFGMCIIAVFGSFNHKKSGMLVLRELKVLVPLAPGDIIFIPSALITHGNTELADDDVRRSWTLFTAGGLFRFWDAGFATERELIRLGEFERLARYRQLQPVLLQQRLDMHMSLAQLRDYYNVNADM